jgi:hypothetical protein
MILNVYYIPSKKERKIDNKIDVIRNAFQKFVSEYFQNKVTGCGCSTGKHLCQVIQGDGGIEKARNLAKNPEFICSKCARVSSSKGDLCHPVKINS